MSITCQLHPQPPDPLQSTVASWPFEAWGLVVVGPLTPKSSATNMYILVAADYFSKRAEAFDFKEVKKENVVDFSPNAHHFSIRCASVYRHRQQ